MGVASHSHTPKDSHESNAVSSGVAHGHKTLAIAKISYKQYKLFIVYRKLLVNISNMPKILIPRILYHSFYRSCFTVARSMLFYLKLVKQLLIISRIPYLTGKRSE
jgi:hypothetical protein